MRPLPEPQARSDTCGYATYSTPSETIVSGQPGPHQSGLTAPGAISTTR